MKKKVCKGLFVILAALLCVIMTSCLGSLLNTIELVYNSAFDTDSDSSREYAFGDSNDLSVTFENGEMFAVWDTNNDYSYALSVKSTSASGTELIEYNEENENFVPGKTSLTALGYDFSQSLNLTLTREEKNTYFKRYEQVEYSYKALSASAYDTYTKPVKAGFKDIDYYIGTRSEWFDFWSYLVIFRENAKLEDNVTYNVESTVYMGYNFLSLYQTTDVKKAFGYEVYSAIDAYEDSAAYTYSYELDSDGKTAHVYLKFTYDPYPDYTSSSASLYRNAHTATEYAHYTEKTPETERVLAIDSVTDTAKVESSDQLYFALKKGYKPNPVKGSNADHLYTEMRRVLNMLISDTDSDAVKTHYIYDYIVDTVVYDYVFTDEICENKNYSNKQLFSYRCLYLEGVFGLGDDGVFDSANKTAICDGLSKAFVCLATMEGIDCLKISGTVNKEGHAWNKVCINGTWYMLDTTWGNSLDSNTKNEYISHQYLLVADDNYHAENDYITYPEATSIYYFGPGVNNSNQQGTTPIIHYPSFWGRRKSGNSA